MRDINRLDPIALEIDLRKFLDSDIDGMIWLLEGRISEEKQKEIISSLMEKIRKEVTGVPDYVRECYAAAMVLPRLSKFLSAEEKQEAADYSISEFFSLTPYYHRGFTAQIWALSALMEKMPEYVSGREQDALNELLYTTRHPYGYACYDLAETLHRLSDFLPGLADNKQLEIMNWLLKDMFMEFSLSSEPCSEGFNGALAKIIDVIGACIKKMKPELAVQWLKKAISTLLSNDTIGQILRWRSTPVFRLAFVDLMIACLDSMADEQKKYFLNYMHPRFLELMGKGERKKNYFMGMLLMICTDCETKQQTKLYALSGMSKWSPYCGMFADKNLFGLIDRLSDGGLSASSTKHNKN